jgi:peptide/nickel transport system permease protein
VKRYVVKRLGLAILMLFLLSIIVFVAGHILPGNPGRLILGNLASQQSVEQLNHQLGADQPLPVQYWNWITGILQGDLGQSYQYREPVSTFLLPALGNSLKLAGVAFIILVPLSVFGGVVAALFRGRALDRAISTTGLSLSTVPEFVSGIVLIVVFGIQLKLLPVTAAAPAGSSFLTELEYLILPAIPLVLVLFGYIARTARSSTVEVLDSDYVRTAKLKGLPPRKILFRHVLRNSMLPTITVIATQMGYLIGGLVVTETLFNYPGLGRLIYTAGNQQDYPMLAAGVLCIGVVYVAATFVADLLSVWLNPRLRLEGVQ